MFYINETIYGNNIKTFPKYKRNEIKIVGHDLAINACVPEDEKIMKYAKYLWKILVQYKQKELGAKPNREIQRFIDDQCMEFSIFNKENNRFFRPVERNVEIPNTWLEMVSLSELTDPYDLMADYFMGCAIERTFNNTWLCYSNHSKRIFVIDENLYIYNITGGKEDVIKDHEILVPFEYAYIEGEIPDFTYCLQHGEYRMLSIFVTKLKPFYKDFIKCFNRGFINKL